MSFLRAQLATARDEYRSITYPGDLSRAVLPARPRWRALMLLGSLGSGAIAATVGAALLLRPLLAPVVSHPQASLSGEMRFTLPSLPRVPGNLSLRDVTPPFVPSNAVRWPSLDDLHLPTFSDDSEHA